MRCSGINPICVIFDPSALTILQGVHGVLITFVNRPEPVITVGDNQCAVGFVTRTNSRLPC